MTQAGELLITKPGKGSGVDHNTTNCIALSREKLGRGVGDQICPPFDGSAKGWGRHRIIDDQGHTCFLSHLGNGFEINHHAPRIGKALDKNSACVFRYRLSERIWIGGFDKDRLPIEFLKALAHQIDTAPVEFVRYDYLLPRRHQGK